MKPRVPGRWLSTFPLAIAGLVNSRSGALVACLTLGGLGCTGEIGSVPMTVPTPRGEPSGPGAAGDVGRIAVHRLNNLEYDNTVQALLGVPSMQRTFLDDGKAAGFDNIAAAFGMTEVQYEEYFNSAWDLAEQTFSDPNLRARIVTCAPSALGDTSCTQTIVKAFGARAYRRPLNADEVASLTALAGDALAAGADFPSAIKQVVRTMLASMKFLYRIEADPNPASTAPHPLNGYELASRLSYLVWSSMPDDSLFQQAASNRLLEDGSVAAEIDRLLQDKRSSNFVSSFGGQWLGMRTLESHQASAEAFPQWNEPLRQAMEAEGLLYFREFLTGPRKMADFFTTDINFVSGPLADLYGIAGAAPAEPMPVVNTTDQRLGFLGLAAFLTLSSIDYRTAPTLRGKWVLENLLCEHISPPPDGVQQLDKKETPSTELQAQNVRTRLAAHRANPACAGCHQILDPIGLGLEPFDGIGRFRTAYPNGDIVDASGVMPDGQTFRGLPDLATLLSKDRRLVDCAAQKVMTYALSRELGASDQPFIDAISARWQGAGLRSLLKEVVLNPTFRSRRGEAQ